MNPSNEYVLSVVCGGVGLYDVDVILSQSQIEDYENKGESVLDELADEIRKKIHLII